LYIIRNIVGFRESENATVQEFVLAPMLPGEFVTPGKKYSIHNLHFADVTFHLTYAILKGSNISVTISSQNPRLRTFSVIDDGGKEVRATSTEKQTGSLSFDAVNGVVYRIRMQ
jgi:hypothetical protein